MATIENLPDDFDELFDQLSTDHDVLADQVFQRVRKDTYYQLMRHRNVTTNSQFLNLHSCARKLFLNKHAAGDAPDIWTTVDFAFGHSVGAGVQAWLQTRNTSVAQFNAFMAWAAPYDMRIAKNKKSSWEAALAVEKFITGAEILLDEWELFLLPSGRAAIEVSFSLDCGNGYKHYGHIDAILRHRITGIVAILELKTTGLSSREESLYANSNQALGYAVILDALFPGLTSYTVFYGVYSSSEREWAILPFVKHTASKAEWIRDVLIDHSLLDTYHRLNFYPKRGESCFGFYRRCEWYGQCDTVPDKPLPELDLSAEAETVDFALSLQDIVNAQQRAGETV